MRRYRWWRSHLGDARGTQSSAFYRGHRTGFRISELLSLHVGDVMQHGKILDQISVQRRHMKRGKAGKTSGRTVKLHPEVRAALSVWLEVLQKRQKGTLAPELPVFCSRVKDPTTGLKRAVNRKQAWRILKGAFSANELQRKLRHPRHAQDLL
jgi:integrase